MSDCIVCHKPEKRAERTHICGLCVAKMLNMTTSELTKVHNKITNADDLRVLNKHFPAKKSLAEKKEIVCERSREERNNKNRVSKLNSLRKRLGKG